ncbi:Altered inheritance of mitochondria protein 6 [Neophaeococcomyces mojaviensis]|uniref:Altered inheritance of mitochondria protein 6 n=1 Tax=Neophaeococcomyces mojaviensis TaxID=3383035 RepID=A0ACC3AAU3_9EURO|nr:Altered inheritance of mitochondria protein 6 [Knufia sp. JES_112]
MRGSNKPAPEDIEVFRNCVDAAVRHSPHSHLSLLTTSSGLIEFVILATGLIRAFFPDEFDNVYESWRHRRPADPRSHWPTDYTADTLPVRCHSHNDYWRTVPLKSAIRAGCTGVEADVWLYGDELYVGHSTSSLTPQRTFRSLYIDPLVELLERQNPNTTFHAILDNPRNGVFDTDAEETLVLLVDFKTDGQELWRYVSEQLEPLRSRHYLTYFNGTSVIKGPITVVVTGNAPFNRVIEDMVYRDMFFDAPLELLGSLAPVTDFDLPLAEAVFDPVEERAYLAAYRNLTLSESTSDVKSDVSNQGQGHSGAAPTNPAIYTPFNSYYASVSFASTIGPVLPFLRRSQRHKIRQQIAGAHAQGLKVRYWNTPGWPRGLRNYIWRVLVVEGVDYLNVDDLRGATMGNWGEPQRGRRWGLAGWDAWGGGWGASARSHAND